MALRSQHRRQASRPPVQTYWSLTAMLLAPFGCPGRSLAQERHREGGQSSDFKLCTPGDTQSHSPGVSLSPRGPCLGISVLLALSGWGLGCCSAPHRAWHSSPTKIMLPNHIRVTDGETKADKKSHNGASNKQPGHDMNPGLQLSNVRVPKGKGLWP